MRFVLGMLSLICFAAAAFVVFAVLSNPANVLTTVLVLVVLLGLAVVFRALRARLN